MRYLGSVARRVLLNMGVMFYWFKGMWMDPENDEFEKGNCFV